MAWEVSSQNARASSRFGALDSSHPVQSVPAVQPPVLPGGSRPCPDGVSDVVGNLPGRRRPTAAHRGSNGGEATPKALAALPGFGIHGIVKELDDPRILTLVEPYAFARLTYVHNDIRVSIVDGGQGRAIRRACVPRRGGSSEFSGITPEIEVDPAVVPVCLLVLENSQLILPVPGAFALRTPLYWDGVKVNDLKRNLVLRAVHASLRW